MWELYHNQFQNEIYRGSGQADEIIYYNGLGEHS